MACSLYLPYLPALFAYLAFVFSVLTVIAFTPFFSCLHALSAHFTCLHFPLAVLACTFLPASYSCITRQCSLAYLHVLALLVEWHFILNFLRWICQGSINFFHHQVEANPSEFVSNHPLLCLAIACVYRRWLKFALAGKQKLTLVDTG